MKRKIKHGIILFVSLILISGTTIAVGQEKEFPVKPINLYIGFAPGGGATHSGNIICEGMKKYLKQPVILNFKPGAAQVICADFVANSKPDGYTLFWIAPADLIAKLSKEGAMVKFQLGDLDSLGAAPYTPFTLAVNSESPWKTVEDLVADARKSPGKVVFGSSSTGAVTHMVGELFSIKTGTALIHVPFSGGGPSITALLGKHVDMCFMSIGSYGSQIQPGGGLRGLAVFDHKRDPSLLDVPTAKERGIDIPPLTSWFGLQAPKGLPKEVRTTLVEAFKNVIKDRDIVSTLTKLGFNISYLNPEEVDKRMQEEYKLFVDVWTKVGLIR